MKYNVFFIWFGFCIKHFCLSPCKQCWEVKIPIFWGERINLNCIWFQFWVLVMLSCLTSRRSGSIMYRFNASTNNINPTIIINMKQVCKLGVKQGQQCKNQEQKTTLDSTCCQHNQTWSGHQVIVVQIPWDPPLIPPTPLVWTIHSILLAISIFCLIFLCPDVFSLKHQAQNGNAFYNVNQRTVPAEHPLWAQMFSSAIKPEIITGGTWDKEEHQLEKKKKKDKLTRKPNPSCCSQPV